MSSGFGFQQQDNFKDSIYDQIHLQEQSLEDQFDEKESEYKRKGQQKEMLEKQEFLNQSLIYQQKEQSPSLYQENGKFVAFEIIDKLTISITESKFLWELLSPFYNENTDVKIILQNLSLISNDKYLNQIFNQQFDEDTKIIRQLLKLLHKYAHNQSELVKSNQFLKIIEQDEHLRILIQIYDIYQEYLDNKEEFSNSFCNQLDIELEKDFSLNLQNKLQKGSN